MRAAGGTRAFLVAVRLLASPLPSCCYAALLCGGRRPTRKSIKHYVTLPPRRLGGGHNSWCAGLKICAIDDSAVLCKGYERLLLPQLSSGEDSVVCCPDTQESIARFMEQVTGSSPVEAARGEGDPLAAKPADIVILDQHIDNVQCFDNEAGEVRLKRFLSLTRPQQQLS